MQWECRSARTLRAASALCRRPVSLRNVRCVYSANSWLSFNANFSADSTRRCFTSPINPTNRFTTAEKFIAPKFIERLFDSPLRPSHAVALVVFEDVAHVFQNAQLERVAVFGHEQDVAPPIASDFFYKLSKRNGIGQIDAGIGLSQPVPMGEIRMAHRTVKARCEGAITILRRHRSQGGAASRGQVGEEKNHGTDQMNSRPPISSSSAGREDRRAA